LNTSFRLLPNIFFLLLLVPILSPRVSGVSLYLFVLIPLIDLKFLANIRFSLREIYLLVGTILLALISKDFFLIVKLVGLAFTIGYIAYLHKEKCDTYVPIYFYILVLVAFVQFLGVVYLGDPLINNANISKALYGDYALQFGNLVNKINYLGLGYRVSGLSTEPAFFSSLLISVYLYIRIILKKKDFSDVFILALGLSLCFSRATIITLIGLSFLYIFKPWLERHGAAFVLMIFLIIAIYFVTYLYEFEMVMSSGSIVHRTIGYFVLGEVQNIDVADIVFGLGQTGGYNYVGSIPEINYSPMAEDMKKNLFDNSGVTEIILQYGLLGFLFFLSVLRLYRIDGFKIMILVVLTINVSVLTSTSFVIIAWLVVILGNFNEKKSSNIAL